MGDPRSKMGSAGLPLRAGRVHGRRLAVSWLQRPLSTHTYTITAPRSAAQRPRLRLEASSTGSRTPLVVGPASLRSTSMCSVGRVAAASDQIGCCRRTPPLGDAWARDGGRARPSLGSSHPLLTTRPPSSARSRCTSTAPTCQRRRLSRRRRRPSTCSSANRPGT